MKLLLTTTMVLAVVGVFGAIQPASAQLIQPLSSIYPQEQITPAYWHRWHYWHHWHRWHPWRWHRYHYWRW